MMLVITLLILHHDIAKNIDAMLAMCLLLR